MMPLKVPTTFLETSGVADLLCSDCETSDCETIPACHTHVMVGLPPLRYHCEKSGLNTANAHGSPKNAGKSLGGLGDRE